MSPCLHSCMPLHPYVGHGPDELKLQKGEGVHVLGQHHNGCLQGASLARGRAGIFPSSSFAPLLRTDFPCMEPKQRDGEL